MGSYVDDAFGGTLQPASSQAFIDFITNMGARHGAEVNSKKTEGPAYSMVILGLLYNARLRICSLDPAKVVKYSFRIHSNLSRS